ncbi:DUF4214 domain-containing protein [Halomonas sp. M20]|uniref:DUF4214 domain-containing protein n=1 Tax=Halomonas sp. M20 TaxID=2763264 RepID=UPI001D09B7E4|nr:DUF4214 domain-containing protein [Halomonas sp. M20]
MNNAQKTISQEQLGSLSGVYQDLVESDTFFKVDYTALNSSGVAGGAFLALNSDTNVLTVVTTGKGVESGVPHPQHIHGFATKADGSAQNSVAPTLAQDADGDGVVELAEGGEVYGPIQLALTDPAGGAIPDFPNASGNSFVQTASYNLNELDAGAMNKDGEGASLDEVLTAQNLDQREIVLHGLTLNGGQGEGTEGEADGTAGYKAVLPIAAGEIERIDAQQAMADLSDGRLGISNDVVAFDAQGSTGKTYRIYDSVLNRAADQEGLSFYTNQMDEGVSHTDIANSLLNSEEFTANFGDVDDLGNDEYVDLLYQNVLDREADGGGREYYVNQLEQGVSRADIVGSFSESEEHQALLVGQYDGGFLLNEGVIA